MPGYSRPPYLPSKPLPPRKMTQEIPGVEWKSMEEQLSNLEFLIDLVGSEKTQPQEMNKNLPKIRKQLFKMRRFMEQRLQDESSEKSIGMDEKGYWNQWGDKYLASINME